MKNLELKRKLFLTLSGIMLIQVALFATSCLTIIKGNGNVVKEERNIAEFSGIYVSSAINIILEKGDQQKVEVETDENIMEHISTEVNGNVLRVKIKDALTIRKATKMNVYVTYTELNKLRASGASSIKGDEEINAKDLAIGTSGASDINININSENTIVDVSGASDLIIEGKTNVLKGEVSGASNFIAKNLVSGKAFLEVSGASDAKINVTEEMNVDVSGASTLKYSGNPGVRKVESSGASDVHRY